MMLEFLRWLPVLVILLGCAGAGAEDRDLVARVDQMACGSSIVSAHASCYGGSGICVRETFTFRRPEGSVIVAPHKHLSWHNYAGRSVEALDYHAASWACLPGTNGGHYVAFVMTRTAGGDCSACAYFRLYHPNGRLIGATLSFDAAGHPREDPRGAKVIGATVGRPGRGAFKPLYE